MPMRARPFFFFLFCFLFAYFAPGLNAENDELRVSFSNPSSGSVPDGWKLKEWSGRAEFAVIDTEIGKAIHLKSNSSSSALYKELKFNIRDYPVLSWKWKVTELPKGGDVRKKETDDQALQFYVIFPKWPAPINSRIIGYIWDATVPAGLMVDSTKSRYTKYVVLKGGKSGLGVWFPEKRNVYEDYKKLFKEEPPEVGSISVMIDSNDTESSAESFIGDISFSKATPH